MRFRLCSDRGSVTAELAVALPVVILMLALCAQVIVALGDRVVMFGQAAEYARRLGRGEDQAEVAARFTAATADVARIDGAICVTLRRDSTWIPLAARACAVDEFE